MRKSKILVKGENLQNFLNALSNRKIIVYDIEFKEDALIFNTDYRNVPRILKLYGNSNYKVELVRTPKYENLKDFFKKNIAILITLCIVFVCCFAYSQHIWQYKVYGLENIDEMQIVEALEDSGAIIGVNKKSLDLEKVENAILHNVEDVGLVSVNVVGTSLIVTISEKINNETILDNTKSLVSNYDCVITSIKTNAGTALVKVGDKVVKGQTLIGNYVLDSEGNQIASKAMGEVYADVYYTYNKTYFSTDTVLERSGNTYKYCDLYICGIPILSQSHCNFQYFESEEKSYYLESPLPIKVVEHTLYELIEKSINIDLNDIENLQENAIKLAQEQLKIEEYDNVILDVSNNGDNVTISVSFVINQKII